MRSVSFRTDDADTVTRVQRYDRGEAATLRRTPEGFLVLDGFAVRPGVLVYRNPDGSSRRELVPAALLADASALASLGRAVLVWRHPHQEPGCRVTPANVERLQVGDVGSASIDPATGYLRVDEVLVRRADAITAVEAGERGLSPGYDADVVWKPGVDPVYGPYDGVQIRRTYNHLAIVPAGRGGPEMALHADAAEQIDPLPTPGDPMDPKLLAILAMAGIAADKADAFWKSLSPEAQAAFQALAGKVSTEVENKDAKPGAPPPGAPAAPPPARMDGAEFLAAFNEREPLVGRARAVGLADAEVAKLDTKALRKAVALKLVPGLRTDGSDDYYAAALDTAKAVQGGSTYDGLKSPGVGRQDAAPGAPRAPKKNRFDEAFDAARSE